MVKLSGHSNEMVRKCLESDSYFELCMALGHLFVIYLLYQQPGIYILQFSTLTRTMWKGIQKKKNGEIRLGGKVYLILN